MAVVLPEELEARVLDALAVAFSRGAVPASFANKAICLKIAVSAPPETQARLLLDEACARHRAGHPTGTLHTIADALMRIQSPCGTELDGWLSALPPEVDPHDAVLVGPWQALLLDHSQLRRTLRRALAGPERVPLVWIPGPLSPMSAGCAEFIRQVGVYHDYEVVCAPWSSGIGLRPEDVAREICYQLGESGELPPQRTTDSAYWRVLAGFVVAAARQRNRKILLLLAGFCGPDCPEPCLQFITWLMLHINNSESPTNPIRMVALGFDPGPRASQELTQMLRTGPDLLRWPELRRQCFKVLEDIGMLAEEAERLLDPQWGDVPDPLPMDEIYAYMLAVLEVARVPDAGLTADEIRRRLAERDATLRIPVVMAWHEAAAVWFYVDLPLLRPGVSATGDPVAALHADCVAIRRAEETVWALCEPQRIAALRRLLADGRIEAEIAANPHESARPENALFVQVLRGAPPDPHRLDGGLLPVYREMARLVEGLEAIAVRPDIGTIDRVLARECVLRPLRLLTDGFVGRGDELRALREHVGVLGRWSLWRRLGLTRPPQRPALVLHGVGGVGKSALIARFVLEHLEADRRDLRIAWLDLERYELSDARPESLAAEIAAQVLALEPGRGSSARSVKDAAGLASAIGARRGDTLLVVLDTLEMVLSAPALVARLHGFLTDVQKVIPGLRVVAASRVPVEHTLVGAGPDQTVKLSGLDRPSAVLRLMQAGVSAAKAEQVIERIGTGPLSLTLAFHLLRTRPDADILPTDPFWRQLDDEELQGFLYTRILERIADPQVRKVAHPGMVLRRIDAQVLLHVLNEPCQLGLKSEEDARGMLARVADEVTLVERDGGELRYRSDLRIAGVRLLQRSRPEAVMRIHEAAIRWYRELPGPQARAEEIWHLLSLERLDEARERAQGEMPSFGVDETLLLEYGRTFLAGYQEIERVRLLHSKGDYRGVLLLLNTPVLRELYPEMAAVALSETGEHAEARALAARALQLGVSSTKVRPTLERIVGAQRRGPYKVTANVRRELYQLLIGLFTEHELRVFLAENYPGLERDLPGERSSMANLVFSAVDMLVRHRYFDAALFSHIRQARPARVRAIDEVELRCIQGVEGGARSARRQYALNEEAMRGLSELLVNIFQLDDLTIFISHHCDEGVQHELPMGPVSMLGFVDAAVQALGRHGYIGPELFEALLQHRPSRAADIEAVERWFVQGAEHTSRDSLRSHGLWRAAESLQELLCAVFSGDELRQFVRRNFASSVYEGLPGESTAFLTLASELVEGLMKQGLVDARLFGLLREERPRRKHDIDQVERLFQLEA